MTSAKQCELLKYTALCAKKFFKCQILYVCYYNLKSVTKKITWCSLKYKAVLHLFLSPDLWFNVYGIFWYIFQNFSPVCVCVCV